MRQRSKFLHLGGWTIEGLKGHRVGHSASRYNFVLDLCWTNFVHRYI